MKVSRFLLLLMTAFIDVSSSKGRNLQQINCAIFDSTKDYHIIARHSNLALRIENDSTTEAAKVEQQPLDLSGIFDDWSFVAAAGAPSGYYHVVNRNSGMGLNVNNYSYEPGEEIIQWPVGTGDNEKFCFSNVGGGGNGGGYYYSMVALHSNLAIDVAGASTAAGAELLQWTQTGALNQQFQVVDVTQEAPSPPSGCDTTFDTTKSYNLLAVHSNKALGVVGTDTGAPAEQMSPLVGGNQASWNFEPVGATSHYHLLNANSLLALNVAGNTTDDGAAIIQWAAGSDANDNWCFQDAGDGAYYIVSELSGDVIDIAGESQDDGATAVQWPMKGSDNQKFMVVEASGSLNCTIFDPTKQYNIIARHSSKAISVADDSSTEGADVVQVTLNSTSPADMWTFQELGDGYMHVFNVNSGKTINVAGDSVEAGSNVIQWTVGEGSNDDFCFHDLTNGFYSIIAKHSQLGIDIAGASLEEGANIIQYTRSVDFNQQFSVVEVTSRSSSPSVTPSEISSVPSMTALPSILPSEFPSESTIPSTMPTKSSAFPTLSSLPSVSPSRSPSISANPSDIPSDGPNPIVAENVKMGTNGWRLNNPGDDSQLQIKGFASSTSVGLSETITFYISVNSPQTYTIDVYRLGYYGGLGGRLVESILPLNGVTQPTCPLTLQTGMISCSWSPSYQLVVPISWVTGVYLAKLTNANGFQNYINFVVRDDAYTGQFLYQQSTSTYHAYNNYPNDGTIGKSLYEFNSFGSTVTASGTVRAAQVSLDRPYPNDGAGQIFSWEHDLIQWLEMMGYDLNYCSNWDTHYYANTDRLHQFEGFLSTGHDEYWSKDMFDAILGARDAGTDMAFFGSNVGYWQIRLESSASGAADRVMVCYKSVSLDPIADEHLKTHLWRTVFRAEQTLVGVQYGNCCGPQNTDFVVQNSSHWMYASSGLSDNDIVPGIVGYEVDNYHPAYPLPPHLSYTLLGDSTYIPSSNNPLQSEAVIYQAPSGSWVFASGTMSWSWALNRNGLVNTGIQLATQNLLERFLAPVDYSPPASGLVALWQMEEDSWSGIDGEVADSTGNQLSGNSQGGVTTSLQGTCRAAVFNGVDQSVRISYSPVLNPKHFSVTLWARVDGGKDTWRSAITSRWQGSTFHGFIVYASITNQWQFWTGDGRPNYDQLSGPAVQENVWTHITVTFQASASLYGRNYGTKRLYINGSNVSEKQGYYQANHNSDLFLGSGTGSGSNYFFNGALDEVRVYNIGLDATAVQDIYQQGRSC